MNSNPRILKLSNGDEIICMVHDTENDYLKFRINDLSNEISSYKNIISSQNTKCIVVICCKL